MLRMSIMFLRSVLGSGAVTFALLSGLARSASADIVLNEVLADNSSAVLYEEDYPDYVELYNTSAVAVDAGGMSLSDTVLIAGKFVLPAGTWIPGHGYLTIWFDDRLSAPGLHTGFTLAADGQTVALFSANSAVVDSLAFGFQIADLSLGRAVDGTGAWTLNVPTAGKANQVQTLGAVRSLKVNEWCSSPASGEDWFEIYNPEELPVAMGGMYLADSLTPPISTPVPAYSYIAAKGFVSFFADEKPSRGARHANFKLSAKGDTIALFDSSRTLFEYYSFAAQSVDVSNGRLPDGTSIIATFARTQSPGKSNYLPEERIVVNEVLSHTDPPFEDAIELLNTTAQAIDISGWYLSNAQQTPRKFKIPAGTVMPAGGYHVFYEYQFGGDGTASTDFTLNSAHGDEVHLFVTDSNGQLTGYRSTVSFDALDNSVSYGRIPISTGFDYAPLAARTFGADNPLYVTDFRTGAGKTNSAPYLGPVVISEIMYHPPDIITIGATNDNTLEEYVELYNRMTTPVPLHDPLHPANTWRLRGGISFSFPAANFFLAAKQTLLVVNFDPLTNSLALAQFRAKYAVPSGTPIFGPYQGKLANGDDVVELRQPDDPQLPPHPDAGFVPYVSVDRVHYHDLAPWPAGADGTGLALRRTALEGYANDPANWIAAAPTPGRLVDSIKLHSASVQGDTLTVSFPAAAGETYTLQGRDSLGTGAWANLAHYLAAPTGTNQSYSESLSGSRAQRFYRLVSPAQP
jgi:hypothetical protein